MAKKKPELPKGWDVESFILAKLIAKKSKILFIYNEDYERLKKIIEMFEIQATIMNDDTVALEKAKNFGFNILAGNVNAGGLIDIKDKEFDYVVAENILSSARYPGDFLKDATRICNHLIVCNRNIGFWKKRIQFLIRGSLYVNNQYNIIPDDNFAWFNQYPWALSHKDVVNLCTCQNLTISKGIIVYNDGYIDNMYDVRSYPNLKATKVYYSITNESTIIPSYRLGGATV